MNAAAAALGDVATLPWIALHGAREAVRLGLCDVATGAYDASASAAVDREALVADAWLARTPWRRIEPDLAAQVDRMSNTATVYWIAGSRILQTAIDALGAALDRDGTAPDATLDALVTAWCEHADATLVTAPRPRSTPRISIGRAGMASSTRDPSQDGRRLGLHVDSQERVSVFERSRCAPLWLLNVGREPRQFMFLPYPLAAIAARVDALGLPAARMNATDVGRAFLAATPHAPIVRLTLRPGDAYIAPVQNLVHDGSTLGMRGEDRTLRAFCERQA